MPNNETIERIAESYLIDCECGCYNHMTKTGLVAALEEMRTVALREAAEIARSYQRDGTPVEHGIAAAILGRIDK